MRQYGWWYEESADVHPIDLNLKWREFNLTHGVGPNGNQLWDYSLHIDRDSEIVCFVISSNVFESFHPDHAALGNWHSATNRLPGNDVDPFWTRLDNAPTIYDYVGPGIPFQSQGILPKNTIVRYRANFRSSAAITSQHQLVRCSKNAFFYVRWSAKKYRTDFDNPNDNIDPHGQLYEYQVDTTYNSIGDNTGGFGQTNLGHDLAPWHGVIDNPRF